MSAATLLAATSRSLQAIIGWRFLQGLVTPGVFAVAVAYIHDRWDGARAATTTAAYVTGTVVGGFLGRVVAGGVAAGVGGGAGFIFVGGVRAGCAAAPAWELARGGGF